MAVSTWGVNDNEAVLLWSRKTMHEALKLTQASQFMGSDSTALCQVHDDTSKSPGDRLRFILRMMLTGNGVQGDDTLEGSEERLVTYTDTITIDQLRHAVRSGGKASEQRVPFEMREEARMALQDWWAERLDQWFFNQLTGNNVTDTRLTGNNSILTPDASHIVFAGVGTAESNLSANATQTFSLEIIDKAVLAARTTTPVIRPLNNKQEPGKHQFVMFVAPEQHYDLRRSTGTGEWQDIQKYALSANASDKNPILAGSLGVYNGVVLHESFRIPLVTTSAANGGARAVLCGAQAAYFALGRGYSKSRMSWQEELFDYGNQLGVSTGIIGGMKKTRFNSLDFGTMAASSAVSTAAAAASQR